LTPDAEALYGLPLDEFTTARDALAARLRAAGRGDEAAEVAALRKPVRAAWVVNRLARDERAEMRRLLDAAAAVRAGRAGAQDDFRQALERLVDAGRNVLEQDGRATDPVVQQVASTLRAGAASTPDELAGGTLTQPLETAGLGAMAGAGSAAETREGRRARPARPRPEKARVERARREVAEARGVVRRLVRAAAEAERAARESRAAVEAARRGLARAEARLERERTGAARVSPGR
jgi:hypothetical protein